MGADDKGYAEVYDSAKNQEDWSFTDLEGNTQKAETNEMFPSHFIKAGNKTVEVYHEKYGTLWGTRFVEGGQMPATLKGRFTSAEDAIKEVNIYVAKLATE